MVQKGNLHVGLLPSEKKTICVSSWESMIMKTFFNSRYFQWQNYRRRRRRVVNENKLFKVDCHRCWKWEAKQLPFLAVERACGPVCMNFTQLSLCTTWFQWQLPLIGQCKLFPIPSPKYFQFKRRQKLFSDAYNGAIQFSKTVWV